MIFLLNSYIFLYLCGKTIYNQASFRGIYKGPLKRTERHGNTIHIFSLPYGQEKIVRAAGEIRNLNYLN